MKKAIAIAIGLVLALSLLGGCGAAASAAGTQLAATAGSSSAQSAAAVTVAAQVDASVSARDASGEYDAASAVRLSPEDDLTITAAGVYILSGTYLNKTLVVDAGKEDKI